MTPEQLAVDLTRLLVTLTPWIIWTWLLMALTGLLYALRLWRRAVHDLWFQIEAGIDGALRFNARGVVRRVLVRVWMFVIFLLIGLCAVGLSTLPPGLWRALTQLAYVLLFLVVNGLVMLNSRWDEQHDLALRVLLRRDERRTEQLETKVQQGMSGQQNTA